MTTMVLFVATDKVGSECECDLGITPEKWHEMTDKEQDETVREYASNIMEMWVEERDDD